MKKITKVLLEDDEKEVLNEIINFDCSELENCEGCPLHLMCGSGCLKDCCKYVLNNNGV